MNWDDGRLFLAVARAGQMRAAATTLGLNQATLSRRVAALEAQLGCRLLIRRPHGCTLTGDGSALLARLERVEAEMLLAGATGDTSGVVRGTVRLGAPDGFGTAFLAPRLAALTRAHPDLVIQLVPAPRSFSLSEREADIAVMVGRPKSGRLRVQKLTDYSLGLYASPAYLEAHGTPATLDALLSAHRLVGYVGDLLHTPELDYAHEISGLWRSDVEVSSALGQCEAVLGGAGIGILHDFVATRSETLVPVLPDVRVTRAYWLAYHETLRGVARIHATVDAITALVAGNRALFLPYES